MTAKTSSSRTKSAGGIGVLTPERALPRKPQTYCGCGEKKRDRARHCLDCAEQARVDAAKRLNERLRVRTAARRQKGGRT